MRNPLADLIDTDVDMLLKVLDGGDPSPLPEDVTEADLTEIRDAFAKGPKLAVLVIRIITRSGVPEEMAAYARRMYDVYTDAGLPENIVAGLVTAAVNAMNVKAGEAVGG